MEPNTMVKSNSIKNPYLNKSIVKSRNLDRSKALLRTSVIQCSLKANNIDLAKSLNIKEQELYEMRKENSRLLRENYDMQFTYKFRQYNYENFLKNYYTLAASVQSIFTDICNLSDGLMEMKNHPFLASDMAEIKDHSFINPVENNPFKARDKIPRSPTKPINNENMEQSNFLNLMTNESHLVLDNSQLNLSNQMDELADKISCLKNKSTHSIHNLSVNIHSSSKLQNSFNQTSNQGNNKTFNGSAYLSTSILGGSSRNSNVKTVPMESIKTPKSEGKVLGKVTRKPTNKNLDSSYKLNTTQPNFEPPTIVSDATVTNNKATISKKSKKPAKPRTKIKNLRLKPENKPAPNKEEYMKNKEKDAYYLSFNETANATLVPTTLNEFKNTNNNNDDGDDVENNGSEQVSNEIQKPGPSKARVIENEMNNTNADDDVKRQRIYQDFAEEDENDDDDDDFVKPKLKRNSDEKVVKSKNTSTKKQTKITKEKSTKATKRKYTKAGPAKEAKSKKKKVEDKENEEPMCETNQLNEPITSVKDNPKRTRRNLKPVNYTNYMLV